MAAKEGFEKNVYFRLMESKDNREVARYWRNKRIREMFRSMFFRCLTNPVYMLAMSLVGLILARMDEPWHVIVGYPLIGFSSLLTMRLVAAFQELEKDDPKDRFAHFRDTGKAFWVAEMKGEIIGFVGVDQASSKVGRILELFVHSGQQKRKDILQALLSIGMEFCENHYEKTVCAISVFESEIASLLEDNNFKLYDKGGVRVIPFVYFEMHHYKLQQMS